MVDSRTEADKVQDKCECLVMPGGERVLNNNRVRGKVSESHSSPFKGASMGPICDNLKNKISNDNGFYSIN